MGNLKIIISPSKTQNLKTIHLMNTIPFSKPVYTSETEQLLKLLKPLSKEALGDALGVKGKKLDEAFDFYANWELTTPQAAITLYTGSVFKAIGLQEYTIEALEYMKNHLRVLSALYGILKPFDTVRPYRLDMSAKVFPSGPAAYWANKLTEELSDASPLVNLASDEFSRLINLPMIHIHFKERTDKGTLVTKSTYAKMARGAMVDFAISNLVEDVELLKNFKWQGYTYSKVHSTEIEWTFIREGAL